MVVHKKVREYPILLAANRDEYFDRRAQGPGLLEQRPAVWGGRDERAGGTWLGVNEYGLVVGLTNRRVRAEQQNDPARRSRGLLCIDVLRCRTAKDAVTFLDRESSDRYNPFNALIADQSEIYWTVYDETTRTQILQPGLHILANGNLNDVETVRIRRARHLLQQTNRTALQPIISLLERVCQDHEQGVQDRETICMHRSQENYGTVSSTILAVSTTPQQSVYRYADGPPCRTSYGNYSHLLHNMFIEG